ncbi:hypothetical protein BH10PSE17_BH10PSE17_02390 [soil metagenome]
MPRLRRIACLLALIVSSAPPAWAEGFSVGVGAGLTNGRVDCVDTRSCDHSDGGWQLSAGYAVDEHIDIRATWFDAGHFEGGNLASNILPFGGRFKVTGIGLTAGYGLDIATDWRMTGRAGIAAVRTRFNPDDPAEGSSRKTLPQPLFGLDLAYQAAPGVQVGLGYDLTRFKVHTTRGALQTFGAFARYSF